LPWRIALPRSLARLHLHRGEFRKAAARLAIPGDQYDRIERWRAAGLPVVLVRVARARGSTPRDSDAAMAVTGQAIAGTIGGGQLEWMATARARQMIEAGETAATMDIPLGPEIGQCCGGRVELSLTRISDEDLATLRNEAEAEQRLLPHVLVFGAGHTGKALMRALEPLPVEAMLIDERPDSLEGVSARALLTPVPEQAVRDAPPGSAFVAMTHSHSLDFLVMAEALKRGDAVYCGMIGSATKRAVFANWLESEGHGRALAEGLTCPIGGTAVRDKRPEVIAAMTAAEILAALYSDGSSSMRNL
jgi:xanthine dehydrogenase accessory factor